jgi:hypothetical protein
MLDRKEGVPMLPNRTNQQMAHWQIVDGMTVYSADGEELGTVRNYDPRAGYLDIQKGWLFTKDFYVGMATVVSVDDDGLSIGLTKQDLEDDRFASPPGAGGAVHGEGFVFTEKEPVDVTDEEALETRPSGMPIY